MSITRRPCLLISNILYRANKYGSLGRHRAQIPRRSNRRMPTVLTVASARPGEHRAAIWLRCCPCGRTGACKSSTTVLANPALAAWSGMMSRNSSPLSRRSLFTRDDFCAALRQRCQHRRLDSMRGARPVGPDQPRPSASYLRSLSKITPSRKCAADMLTVLTIKGDHPVTLMHTRLYARACDPFRYRRGGCVLLRSV
jgi:hypothetical protein